MYLKIIPPKGVEPPTFLIKNYPTTPSFLVGSLPPFRNRDFVLLRSWADLSNEKFILAHSVWHDVSIFYILVRKSIVRKQIKNLRTFFLRTKYLRKILAADFCGQIFADNFCGLFSEQNICGKNLRTFYLRTFSTIFFSFQKFPPTKDYIRGTVYLTINYVKALEKGCQFTYLTLVDPKGFLFKKFFYFF